MNTMQAQELLKKYHNFVVIGVSDNPDKYGYKIFKRLLYLGYTTYGVSPKYTIILNQPIYPSLRSIQKNVDVAVFVINPKIGSSYVAECKELDIQHLWLQPGSFDQELLEKIAILKLHSYENCILVETKVK